MKVFSLKEARYLILFFCIYSVTILKAMEKKSQPNSINPSIVSYVDYSLIGSQKYVLRVDDKPFYMTNIQIRLDKLRYFLKWDAANREAIIACAAADGFNIHF